METQQDMRLITDTVLKDLRMAGFMVPKHAAVGLNDGGTAGPDILCVSGSRLDQCRRLFHCDRALRRRQGDRGARG